MKHFFSKVFFHYFCFFFFWNVSILSAVLAGTKIKTSNGFSFVDDIQVGDFVTGCSDDNFFTETKVIAVSEKKVDTTIAIKLENEILYVSETQKFYDLVQKKMDKGYRSYYR